MGGDPQGSVPRVNNVRHDDVRRDAVIEFNEVVIVRGGSAISTITGSEGALMGGTESSRPENSGAENDSGASVDNKRH